MSILLKAVQRRNPRDIKAPMKWYPVQKSTGMVGETRVADLIADETTLNPAEALMSIRQLYKVVLRLLLDGHSVQLGNWGSFSVTLNTKGNEKKDALTARDIEKVNVNFMPGVDMKLALQKADFVWIEKLTSEESSGGGSDENPDIL